MRPIASSLRLSCTHVACCSSSFLQTRYDSGGRGPRVRVRLEHTTADEIFLRSWIRIYANPILTCTTTQTHANLRHQLSPWTPFPTNSLPPSYCSTPTKPSFPFLRRSTLGHNCITSIPPSAYFTAHPQPLRPSIPMIPKPQFSLP